MNQELKQYINDYEPFDDQEAKDKEFFLKFIDTFDDVLTRNNEFGHFTASAFVVNKERNKMLVVLHNIYGAWIYPGGHADGEKDLLSVAIREVFEETGQKVKILDKRIFGIQSLPEVGHIKRGKYISAHPDLDVIYIFEADDKKELTYREEESKGVKWIPLEEATDETIVNYIRPINKKLIKKLKIKNL